jgi:hypothetical protein
MIQVILILNYYGLIGCIEFSFGLYNTVKFLDLAEVPILQKVHSMIYSFHISDWWEEVEAAYLQSSYTHYDWDHTFSLFIIHSPCVDWEIKNGLC